MTELDDKLLTISNEFRSCQKFLTAVGDPTRQHIILEMIKMTECGGVRVNEVTARTNLSRPAVSHHLQILKDAGILKMRRDGTKNYYYFDTSESSIEEMQSLLVHIQGIMSIMPDRKGNDD
jgi:DNA-binding transcriptional ArsR family regulator